MSEQVRNRYYCEGEECVLLLESEDLRFNPKDYGLKPEGRASNCLLGYWCDFSIEKGKIFLKNLYINTAEGFYPKLNGKSVSDEKYEKSCTGRVGGDGKLKLGAEMRPSHMGYCVYEDVYLEIIYTGKLLFGRGIISSYAEKGLGKWAYEKLFELSFEKGKLLKMSDFSSASKYARAIFDEKGDAGAVKEDDKLRELEERFSAGYKDIMTKLKEALK